VTSLHVSVVEVDSTTRQPSQGHLPFVGEAFDLVMSRHDDYAADEVARVLRGGGRLVTQQVGDRTNLDLHQLLGAPAPDRAPWSADVARVAAEAAGLRVLRAEDAYPITRFHDVGAIAYYLKAVAWEIPDFTVDRYAEPLLALHRQIERTLQPLDVGFHLFLLVAERTSPG
jgi:SAM-dependent methyltransferase